jgi:hypothetical protein
MWFLKMCRGIWQVADCGTEPEDRSEEPHTVPASTARIGPTRPLLEDAEHLIAIWKARQDAHMPMLFSPLYFRKTRVDCGGGDQQT